MTKLRERGTLLAALLALAGCGTTSPSGSASAPSPTTTATSPTATPATGPELVVAFNPQPQNPSQLGVLDLTGHVLATIPFPAGAQDDPAFTYGVGPHHIWTKFKGQLTFYGSTGTKLASDPYAPTPTSQTSDPVFSADGSTWLWSGLTSAPQGSSSQQWTTTVYQGTVATPMRSVATYSLPFGNLLAPVGMHGNTAYFVKDVVVGGGGGRSEQPGVVVMDLNSDAFTPLPLPHCFLDDVATDGSLLCLTPTETSSDATAPVTSDPTTSGNSGLPMTVRHPDGTTVRINVPAAPGYQCAPATLSADAKWFVQDGNAAGSLCDFVPTLTGPTTGVAATVISATGASSGAFLPDDRLLITTMAADGTVTCSIRGLDGSTTPLKLPPNSVQPQILASPEVG